MQSERQAKVKKSPWANTQSSIDGEKQSRALYHMYGPDDSRTPKKAQAGWPPTARLTWQSQLRAYIHSKRSCTIMELRMYHGALLLLKGLA